MGELGIFSSIGVDKKIRANEKAVILFNYMDVYRHKRLDVSIPKMMVTASERKIAACTVEAGDLFITPTSETRDDIGHAAVAIETIKNACYSYHLMRFRLNEKNLTTAFYLCYLFESSDVQKQIYQLATGLTRFGLSKSKFASIRIPLPPLSEQARIVRILDRFDALCNDLIDGLPAEIEGRKKQYAYYRDQLLSFEKPK
ncbi:MAG: restriction endonuclease subunit S [Opitutales bacterium]|nr:restriction endonuclease subunit S [Opitutales bacterium]